MVPKGLREQVGEFRWKVVLRLAERGFTGRDDAVSGPGRGMDIGQGPVDPMPCPPIVRLIESYGETGDAPEVLFFADSTFLYVSHRDMVRKSLLKLVLRELAPLRACQFAHVQYCAPVHAALLKVLASLPQRPRIIFMPIHLRQFGQHWAANPNLQFRQLIDAADAYIADPSAGVRVVPRLTAGVNRVDMAPPDDPEGWARYLEAPVTFPDGSERTVGDFTSALAKRPTNDLEREERFRLIFAVHYLFTVEADNIRLIALNEAMRTATAMGCEVVTYIAPVNYETGRYLLGSPFDDAVERTRAIAKEACASPDLGPGGLHLHDLTYMLNASEFFSRWEVLGHLNEFGRRRLAPVLGSSVTQVTTGAAVSQASG